MKKKGFFKSATRILGLAAFILTGGGLVVSTVINEENIHKTEILLIMGAFFIISLIDHYKKLIKEDD